MKKLNKIALSVVVIVVAGIGFSGCGGAPSCDGKDTTATLTQILKENVSNKAEYKYSAFMTNSTDKKAKKVTCKAQVTVSVGNKQESDFIQYSAQYTDDGQIYVEVFQ